MVITHGMFFFATDHLWITCLRLTVAVVGPVSAMGCHPHRVFLEASTVVNRFHLQEWGFGGPDEAPRRGQRS